MTGKTQKETIITLLNSNILNWFQNPVEEKKKKKPTTKKKKKKKNHQEDRGQS